MKIFPEEICQTVMEKSCKTIEEELCDDQEDNSQSNTEYACIQQYYCIHYTTYLRCSLEMVEDCMTREEEVCEDVTTMECRVVEKKACTTVREPVRLTI